jgi:hypothetical protein
MASPPEDKPGKAAPPRKSPEPSPDPVAAPHGWTWIDGDWRPKKAPGRPRTADKPRVTDAPAPPKTGKADPPKTDHRKALRETCEALWFALAVIPVPDKAFGYSLGGLRTRLRVQAHLVETNVDALAAGLNTVGQHNGFMARALSRLSAGEAGLWVLPAALMLAPFVAQTGQLWSGQLADDSTLDAIAGQTEAKVTEYVEKLAAASVEGTTEA